jgi:hypothetical protein
VAALLIYTSWDLWKEQNRRIFYQVAATTVQMFCLIKEEMKLHGLALGDQGVQRDTF